MLRARGKAPRPESEPEFIANGMAFKDGDDDFANRLHHMSPPSGSDEG